MIVQQLITAAALTATGLATPSQSITRQDLIRQLNSIGVQVHANRNCGASHQNNHAIYHYDRNTICLSSNTLNNTKLLDQSLTHESMHVVQDCVAGIDNEFYMPLTTYFRKIKIEPRKIEQWRQAVLRELRRRGSIDHVRNVTVDSLHADVEAEAYAFENHPDDVHALLKAFC